MSKYILVVDDEEDVRSLIQLGLEMQSDWTVLDTNNGEDAIAMASEHKPDVILLDWMMPDMDGKTTLRMLKSNPDTQKIPVIIMTAKSKSFVEDNFDSSDVAAIFVKPLRPLNLSEEIIKALGWKN